MSRIHDYNILIIQKSQENRFITTFYNSCSLKFTLYYSLFRELRVYIYINKKLNIKKWEITHYLKDIQTITINIDPRYKEIKTLIYNIYNLSSQNKYLNISKIIEIVRKYLQIKEGRYILLGDFNLYYSLQKDLERNKIYELLNTLINIIIQKEL